MKELNLEDIIKQERGGYISDVFNTKEVLKLMKLACLQTLELASEEAELVEVYNAKDNGFNGAWQIVLNKQSILNLKDRIK